MPLINSHLIAAVVVLILRVAFDPVVVQLVLRDELQELLPQIDVQRGLFVAFDPAALLPAVDPALFQRVNDVARIGLELHDARLC